MPFRKSDQLHRITSSYCGFSNLGTVANEICHCFGAEHDPFKIYPSFPGSLLVAFAFYISVAPVVWVVLAAKDLVAVPASNPLPCTWPLGPSVEVSAVASRRNGLGS